MREIFLNGLGEMMGRLSPRVVVFFDIDKTIRWGKNDPSQRTIDAILNFQKKGGLAIPITGGPLKHVPTCVREKLPIIFAESGAAGLVNGQEKLFAPADQCSAIEYFLRKFSIAENDGYANMKGRPVILEGPRKASITIVSGEHPDYPLSISTPIGEIAELTQDFVERNRLPLNLNTGTSERYSWVDITTLGKEDVVAVLQRFLRGVLVYFIGDGLNDLKSMLDPGVIPIAVENSIAPIQEVAIQRGIRISRPGPDGGVAEALQLI